MDWGEKDADWQSIVDTIQSEINANKKVFDPETLSWIQHYLDHDEYSMAFEYLYLEIMEREDAVFSMGVEKARELALFFDLDKEQIYDELFWDKISTFLANKENKTVS